MSGDLTKTGSHDSSGAVSATLRGLEKLMRTEFREVKDDIREIKKMSENTKADHENRLRLLEAWRWKSVGLASLVPTLFAMASLAVAILALLKG